LQKLQIWPRLKNSSHLCAKWTLYTRNRKALNGYLWASKIGRKSLEEVVRSDFNISRVGAQG
jgi:hypothetical protein